MTGRKHPKTALGFQGEQSWAGQWVTRRSEDMHCGDYSVPLTGSSPTLQQGHRCLVDV